MGVYHTLLGLERSRASYVCGNHLGTSTAPPLGLLPSSVALSHRSRYHSNCSVSLQFSTNSLRVTCMLAYPSELWRNWSKWKIGQKQARWFSGQRCSLLNLMTWEPHGKRREFTLESCSVTAAFACGTPAPTPNIHTYIHTYTHTHSLTNKCLKIGPEGASGRHDAPWE